MKIDLQKKPIIGDPGIATLGGKLGGCGAGGCPLRGRGTGLASSFLNTGGGGCLGCKRSVPTYSVGVSQCGAPGGYFNEFVGPEYGNVGMQRFRMCFRRLRWRCHSRLWRQLRRRCGLPDSSSSPNRLGRTDSGRRSPRHRQPSCARCNRRSDRQLAQLDRRFLNLRPPDNVDPVALDSVNNGLD